MICPKTNHPSRILLPFYLLDSQSRCVKCFNTQSFQDDLLGPEMAEWMEKNVKKHGIDEMTRFIKCLDCAQLLPKYRFYAFTCLARRGLYYPSPLRQRNAYHSNTKDMRRYRLNNWRRLALLRWRKQHNLLVNNLNDIFRADVFAFIYGGAVIRDSKWEKIQNVMREYNEKGLQNE